MFDQHIFISYAHIDNEPLGPDQQGWISRFHEALAAMLGMRLGDKALIWRDDRLRGNDMFANEIVCQFPRTALLVSILSPRYIGSEWCTREVEAFCQAAESSGGLLVDNKSRILKVIKTPVPSEELLPAVMRGALGYTFYTMDGEAPLELDPAYGDDHAQKYRRKVAILAWDMAQTINLLKTGGAAQLPAPGGGGNGPAASTGNGHASTNGGGNGQSGTAVPAATRCVYLAECSYDRREAREILEAELRLHGCTVLPDQRMPADEADYVTAVQEQLERSELSIHIVGSAYGAVPDGPSGKSTVVLQNELAIGRSRSAGLRRLIWLPTSTQSQQQDQQQFIDSLHNDADAQFGADLITGDLETLKGAVHAAFAAAARKQSAKSRPEKADGLTPLVYLICDKRDRTETLPLRRYLIDQGMDVEIPVFEGNAAAVRQAHNDLLTQCDAVVVHYGAGDEVWRRTVVNDLRKLRSIRERPLRHIFTYLGLPASEDKDELTKLGDPNYLDGRNGFTESLLDPLVDRFR